MKLAEGTIKAFKYWPDTGNKYGDFSMSVLLDEGPNGENWYGFGNCKTEAWNRKISEGVFQEVQRGALLEFPYDDNVSKEGNEGRSAKRSQVSFKSYGEGGTGGTGGGTPAPSGTSGKDYNSYAEVGQILNLAHSEALFRNPKGWTWQDVSNIIPSTITAVDAAKEEINAQLTALRTPKPKAIPEPSPSPQDDYDDDIPF